MQVKRKCCHVFVMFFFLILSYPITSRMSRSFDNLSFLNNLEVFDCCFCLFFLYGKQSPFKCHTVIFKRDLLNYECQSITMYNELSDSANCWHVVLNPYDYLHILMFQIMQIV